MPRLDMSPSLLTYDGTATPPPLGIKRILDATLSPTPVLDITVVAGEDFS